MSDASAMRDTGDPAASSRSAQVVLTLSTDMATRLDVTALEEESATTTMARARALLVTTALDAR